MVLQKIAWIVKVRNLTVLNQMLPQRQLITNTKKGKLSCLIILGEDKSETWCGNWKDLLKEIQQDIKKRFLMDFCHDVKRVNKEAGF